MTLAIKLGFFATGCLIGILAAYTRFYIHKLIRKQKQLEQDIKALKYKPDKSLQGSVWNRVRITDVQNPPPPQKTP